MATLNNNAKLGRPIREDEPAELGRATTELVCEAIDAGRTEEAKRLARYVVTESKYLHDWFCDLIYNLLSEVAARHGEEEMYQVLRTSSDAWSMRRTWKAFPKLSIPERVCVTAEIMRAHHSGPRQDGGIQIVEDEEKYSLILDPCGSGGRMRRGDPVDGSPSRLGEPYRFGATQEAHDWCWNRKGVPYYCVHCAVNELLPMEWGGHPMWITEYDDDAAKPCVWHIYKRAESIPERYYTRMGRRKPAAGDGTY